MIEMEMVLGQLKLSISRAPTITSPPRIRSLVSDFVRLELDIPFKSRTGIQKPENSQIFTMGFGKMIINDLNFILIPKFSMFNVPPMPGDDLP